MKSKSIVLLMLTMVSMAPIQAVTKDQAAGAVMTKEDQKAFDLLFKAIDAVNVNDALMVLKENDRMRSFLSSHRQKGLTALDKINEKLKENSASALSRGEKAAVTRKLRKIESVLQEEEAAPRAKSKRKKTEKSSEMRAMPVVE